MATRTTYICVLGLEMWLGFLKGTIFSKHKLYFIKTKNIFFLYKFH